MKLFLILLASLIINTQAQNKPVEIPSVFSDNMVLQQNTNVKFWGKAEAGTKIKINASWGKTSSASTKADGTWLAELATPKAGGPFTLTISIGDSVITYKNILAGEVWLCSGQSNMEMPLQGWPPNDTIMNSAAEIKNANYDQVRFITVPHAYSENKQFNFKGSWKVCTPEAAKDFSATAFFFGKKLHNELKVPIGLIFTSWGGTLIEAWTSEEAMTGAGLFAKQLGRMKDGRSKFEVYASWLKTHPVIDISKKESDEKYENLDFNDKQFSGVNFSDQSWKEIDIPGLWENTGIGEIDGIVWFRKKISIPTELINKDLVIELGPIDDMDRTYINGNLIGSTEKVGLWQKDRVYKIPAAVNNNSEMTIAIRVMDIQGGGGLFGLKEKLKITDADGNNSIVLGGKWKYFLSAEYLNDNFYLLNPDGSDNAKRPEVGMQLTANSPAVLYNAMINPLVPYTIKGAIWYQGEANVSNPQLYAKQLPLMIKDWRKAFDNTKLPFYFVQIAPYDYGDNNFSQALREAQFKSMAVPHTGMAVTMDIGNPKNIHPTNKKDVGERLALWTLRKDYGRVVEYSGPVYKSYKTKGDKIVLSFNYAKGLTVKPINGSNNFEIAGDDKVFKPAVVKIEGGKLIISGDGIKKPKAVRYAWSNTAEGTLFNEAGLPSSSFRTDDWEK